MPTADRDEQFLAETAEREAFEAHFPLKAFEPMARALNTSTTPENIERIRGWLMPYLYHYFSGRPVNEPPRTVQVAKLSRLCDALALVRDALPPRGSIMDSPWTLREIGDGADEKFLAALDRLCGSFEKRLRELEATPVRRGPKPKTQFRDFSHELILIYEKMTGKQAGKPYSLRDSGNYVYGGKFYNFAVTVWNCIKISVPEVSKALPSTKGALAQELQDHWPQKDATAG